MSGIAVTGYRGHLGRRIWAALASDEARLGLDLPEFDLAQVPDALPELEGVEVLIHLAGIKEVALAASEPERARRVNVEGTARLAAAAAAAGVQHLVFASTVHVYGRGLWEDGEIQPWQVVPEPASVYAQTKLEAEQALRASAMPRVSLVRLSNIYGPGMASGTVVSDAVEQAVRGPQVRMRTLRTRRDFLFVDDAAEGLLAVARSAAPEDPPAAWHVSSGRATSIEELCQGLNPCVQRVHGQDMILQESAPDADPGPGCAFAYEETTRLSGWEPSTSLAEGLRKTFEWAEGIRS